MLILLVKEGSERFTKNYLVVICKAVFEQKKGGNEVVSGILMMG